MEAVVEHALCDIFTCREIVSCIITQYLCYCLSHKGITGPASDLLVMYQFFLCFYSCKIIQKFVSCSHLQY
jgi:hypothetical protein